MPLKLSNNAIGTLVSSMTASDTSVVLAPGQGAKFPALVAGEWFPITVVRASNPNQFEIMHATARSGDVLTVTRAREGTVAITFSVGDIVEHRLTKDALDRDFVRLGPDSLDGVRVSVAADGSNLKATVHADGKELKFGTAATRDVGTGANEVPTNDDLGSAAFANIVQIVGSNAFYKADYTSPCIVKTGAQALSIKAGTAVMIGGEFTVFSSNTPVVMPTLSGGSDYSVWVNPDGTAQAVADPFNSPASPTQPGSRKIGGFHYGLVAPGTTVASGGFSTSGVTSAGGSMAWTQADVDRIAGINEFSIWDLAWRCKGEQRGMAYDPISNAWAAIYFMGTSPHIDGPSAYNTDVASGTVLPFIPPEWGGDGVLKYAAMNSWTANELVTAFGHRLIRYEEFVSMAFGVTEGQSLGGPESTIPATKREPGYTSRIGLEQATGHQFVIGGPIHSVGGSSWSGNGRGLWYGGSGQVRLGGSRTNAAHSGSRTALFSFALSNSSWSDSVRAVSDHLKLVGVAR